jgi:hypothetical protein
VTPTASSTEPSSSWKSKGPGCHRSAAIVSRTTAPILALSGAASQTAKPQSRRPDPARRGTRFSAVRSVAGSWRTQNDRRPSQSTPATEKLPTDSSKSRPLSTSSTPRPMRSTIARRSAPSRLRQRYGAVANRSSDAGTAAACERRNASNGANCRSTWWRQPMLGVTAEARLTRPARAVPSAASFGKGSPRRTARKGAARPCRPRRQDAVSRCEGTRSRQSFATSQSPSITATAGASPGSTLSKAAPTASASRTAAPRCHSCTRVPRT